MRASRQASRQAGGTMLTRSAVIIGHEPSFHGWLRTTGVTAEAIAARSGIADRTVYLVDACADQDEIEEVVADIFEEIFRRELARWQPDEAAWPDTADFALFTRWFTVEGLPGIVDVGRGPIAEEAPAP